VGDSLEFRVLGEVEAVAGRNQVELGHARRRSLLAVLLADAGRVVSTDQMIERMWGGHAPVSARNIVSGYVTRLRAAFAEATGADPPLRRRAGGYLISVDPGAVDLHRFRCLVDAARDSPEPGRAIALLGGALALPRGAVFAGLPSPWLEHLAELIEEEVWSARLDYADLLLRLGRHTAIAADLRAWADERRLDERLAGQLMTALYQSGHQAQAINRFHEMRERLADQLGVDPGPQLSDLYQQILRNDPALAIPRPARTAILIKSSPNVLQRGPQQRGTSPQISASKPEAAAVSSAASPVTGPENPLLERLPATLGRECLTRGPGKTPAELPHDVRNFVGRAAELAQLDALLASDSSDPLHHGALICAIDGLAGIGKTALAIHWAHRVADRFLDGQLYVDLRGYDRHHRPLSHSDALAQLLRSLGTDAARIPADPRDQGNLYRSMLAGKRMLILLDNAAFPDHVRPLLPGTGSCVVLITSRKTLTGLVASEGAYLLTLDRLGSEEAHHLLRGIVGDHRVAAEPEPACMLAEQCGHVPLALRIAAANLAAQPRRPIANVVTELAGERRLAALTAHGDECVAVRSAFDLSYRALSPDVRRTFRRLGLIPGPHVTSHTAAALIQSSVGRATRLLDVLAAAHLVERHASGLYRFHDLIRLYARERTQAEDTSQQRRQMFRRVLHWYIDASIASVRFIYPNVPELPRPPARGAPVAVPFADRHGALGWLESERPNLVAAIGEAAQSAARREAWQLAHALYGFFVVRMYPADWLACAEAGMKAACHQGDELAQAAMHNSLSCAHWRLGHYGQAIGHCAQALEASHKCGWRAGEAAAAGILGNVHWELGKLDEAIGHYTTALAIHRDSGHRLGEASALGNLGLVHNELGEIGTAVGHYTTALAIQRDSGYRFGEANVSSNLGNAYRELGFTRQAVEHLVHAVAVHREIGCRNGEAAALEFLARTHLDAGRRHQALDHAHQAVALACEVGDCRIEADALNTMATAHQQLRQHDTALDLHQRALRTARATGNQRSAAEALAGLTTVCRCLHRREEALLYGKQGLTICRDHRFSVIEGQTMVSLGAVYLQEDMYPDAIKCSQDALAVHCRTGHRLGQARALHILGAALWATNKGSQARSCWAKALKIFTDIESPEASLVPALLAGSQQEDAAIGLCHRT
jgi:DNA-binding SARP family transcriptional activator/tetratricopeptide (TPR) repeat protein